MSYGVSEAGIAGVGSTQTVVATVAGVALIGAFVRHALRSDHPLIDVRVVMHTVGRTYAAEADVTLGTLMDYLPADNDPGCPAGFAHGLVTGVAPDIDASRPREAASVCNDAGTRFQRYSYVHGFGHAFMRLYEDLLEPALGLCTALGPQAAPDCTQGAYHDYWVAVVGADETTLSEAAVTDPRVLCGAQPATYVLPAARRRRRRRPPRVRGRRPAHRRAAGDVQLTADQAGDRQIAVTSSAKSRLPWVTRTSRSAWLAGAKRS